MNAVPRTVVVVPATLVLCALAAGLAPAADPPAPVADPGPRIERLVITFKTHFDIGYTDLAANVVQRYRTTMIDQALEVCDASRDLPAGERFVWTVPGWPLAKIVEDWPGQAPGRKERVLQAFRDGRFAVHALPFTLHTELLELEDLVSGLEYASGLSRSVGLALPRDAKMTDVPCHSWVLPTLLRHAGVEFLHLGCNAASRSPEVPILFWWEGPDGSRLLTMYTAESYGTGIVPPEGWPYRTWLALVHTGDNHGPPRPDEVRKLLSEAREKLPGAKITVGRLSDFADAILAEEPRIPVVRGDMPDTWIHGPLSDPVGARIARNVRPALAACESLGVWLRAAGVDLPDATPALAAAREQSLLYGEHTWGGALYWVASYSAERPFRYGKGWEEDRKAGRFLKLEESWAEHTGYIEHADRLVGPALAGELGALARSVDVAGPRIVVWNPLPRKRDDLVRVRWSGKGPPPVALRPADGREFVPASVEGDVLSFIARDVPPTGHKTYVPLEARSAPPGLRADAAAGVLESRALRVTLDVGRGTVRSIIDRRSGRELVDSSLPHGFGQYLHERFDAEQVRAFVDAYVKIDAAWGLHELGKSNLPGVDEFRYRAASPEGFSGRFAATAVSATAVLEAPPGGDVPHAVTTRITVPADLPWVELEVTLEEKPADPWPEAGWVCLPVKAGAPPRFRLGRQASIVDVARDLVPGSNHHLFGLMTGLEISDDAGAGIGLCPIDQPLVSLDAPGCWKHSRVFAPRRPIAYVNLFNNQWTTNFRLWNSGTISSRIRVWATDPKAAESWIQPSLEARNPLLAAFADGPSGTLPRAAAGLEVSRDGILVTAVRTVAGGTAIRLWEVAGRSGPCDVRLPRGLPAATVQPVTLRGEPVTPAKPIQGGSFRVDSRAFAPATFVVGEVDGR